MTAFMVDDMLIEDIIRIVFSEKQVQRFDRL